MGVSWQAVNTVFSPQVCYEQNLNLLLDDLLLGADTWARGGGTAAAHPLHRTIFLRAQHNGKR